MVESSKHKLNLKVKILKLLQKKEENKHSVNWKSLIGSVSFYRSSLKEVMFLFIKQQQNLQDFKSS